MAQFDPVTGERIDAPKPTQTPAPKPEQQPKPEPTKGDDKPQKGGK